MAIAIGKPSKVNGTLKVSKPNRKVSADEPANTLQASPAITGQGDRPNPGATTVQGGRFNPGASPQQQSNVPSPQNASSSVNAKLKPQLMGKSSKGMTGAIGSRLFGKSAK